MRALENNLQSCTVLQRIGIGILPVDIIKDNSVIRIIMTQGKIEISPQITDENRHNILCALNLADPDLDERCPIQIVSTGHSKVMVGIKSREILNSLVPDFTQLVNISRKVGSNGFFVFTLDSDDNDILTHGRMFAPAIGITEDPVTGNGHGPLGVYLVHHNILKTSEGSVTFNGRQGEAIKRPGVVTVTVAVEDGKPFKVQVGGHAVVAFKTEIEI
ncbi:MAG: PhzF family phenazine biosynthesis isomerase [Caldithrix sp.]|nr:MAG: PhzF family phenazine biosynthesis isomerase [Caldithrix sp.]